jgi:hypothetical protein
MSDTDFVILTREDAVKTQLDTAAWLWFLDEPPGPIHALADNALTILNDIGSKIGKETHFYSKAMHEQVGRDLLKGLSNFLKHGSKDANDAYKFKPLWTEGIMLDAINSVGKLYPPMSLLMATFVARVITSHFAAGRVERGEAEVYLPKGVTLEEVTPLGRFEFLQTVLPLFAERGPREP